MADTAARNGSISPLESGKKQKVTFRNIIKRYFSSSFIVNRIINDLVVSFRRVILLDIALFEHGAVSESGRGELTLVIETLIRVLFKMMLVWMRALNRAHSHLLQALVCELEENQVCCSITSSLCPSVSVYGSLLD